MEESYRLLAVLLRVDLLAELRLIDLLAVLLLVELLRDAPARFLLLAAFLALSDRSLAFLFLVRAAFLAAALRCAFVCAMFLVTRTRQYVVKVRNYCFVNVTFPIRSSTNVIG